MEGRGKEVKNVRLPLQLEPELECIPMHRSEPFGPSLAHNILLCQAAEPVSASRKVCQRQDLRSYHSSRRPVSAPFAYLSTPKRGF